jgi:hypothetical protein
MATRPQCLRALELYERTLSGYKNVVGLGVVPLEQRKRGSREYGVAVYVSRIVRRIEAADRIPGVLRVPGKKEEVEIPVRVIEAGEVSLEEDEFNPE